MCNHGTHSSPRWQTPAWRLPPALFLPNSAYPQQDTARAAVLNADFTVAEVVSQLPKLHNGRSAGHADLPAEFLRYAQQPPQPNQPLPPHLLAPTLAELFTTMMTSGNVPSSVNLALVTPCHKRGRKDDPNNFRPIAVTHPLMKLYAGLLNTRLLEYTEEHGLRGPSQAGFRPGHSVVHQIFSLQHMVDKQMQASWCLYICFLDLKSARMNGGSGSRLGAGASPMTLPLTPAAMQRFLRFRTGCHGLPENVGSQSGVPRHQRVCQLCGFGDEMHLV